MWHGDPGSSSRQRATPGTVIGERYELRSPIGNGGMGTVWQAVDTVLRRDVAVKEVLLPPGMGAAERSAMYERTFREARAAAALSHPSVVQVYDVVTEGGRPWIVMELLQARSLSEIIIADGPIAGRAVAKIGIALLGALEVAHDAGVLHRDVKPANVLICADGRCVLTDFGVARMPSESNLTQPGMVLGSPHFISPERAIGAAFGPPSDLFSLGVTLYTAIEGRPPFDRGDPFETMRAIVEDQPLPPVRAGVLAPTLLGLLEKDPFRRWTVAQARASLRELAAGPLAGRAATAAPAQVRPVVALTPAYEEPPPTPAQRALGGRALLADGESVADRLRNNGQVPPPRVGSVFDDGSTSGMPAANTGGFTDTTHKGLPAVSGRTAHSTSTGGGLKAKLGSWPRGLQIGAAAGLAAVVLAAIIVVVANTGGTTKVVAGPTMTASPSTSAPLTNVQQFVDKRGIQIDVPAGWKKGGTSNYTDFTDPDNPSRRVRINVEPSGKATAKQFLTVAERNLHDPSRCTAPYQRISLTSQTLSGHDGAILEYTCGSGTGKRHGIWAATTVGGKAYHFYLTVPDSEFDSHKYIFEQMVQSFTLIPPAV
jgi:serine/threonine protein kinase